MHSASINCARWRFVKRKTATRSTPDLYWIAPGSQQMEVVRSANGGYAVRCFSGQKVSGHMPFRTFYSVPLPKCSRQQDRDHHDRYGKRRSGGIIGNAQKGAFTIGQDKASCVVYGMPMVAYNIGAVSIQAGCEQIPSVLLNHLKKSS